MKIPIELKDHDNKISIITILYCTILHVFKVNEVSSYEHARRDFSRACAHSQADAVVRMRDAGEQKILA